MRRRTVLTTVVGALSLSLTGCASSSFDRNRSTSPSAQKTTTPTQTQEDRTVPIGPQAPGCPSMNGLGKHWGQMGRITEEYDQPINSASQAQELLQQRAEEDVTREYRVADPRPTHIRWQGNTYNVTEKHGTENWYLFFPKQYSDARAALVVGKSEKATVIYFFVGDC